MDFVCRAYSITTLFRRSAGMLRRVQQSAVWLVTLLVMMLSSPSLQALTLTSSSDGEAIGSSLGFLMDEQGRIGIEEARQASGSGLFHALGNADEPNFGYTHATLWLHAGLADVSQSREWLLQLAFSSLDEVEVYLFDKQSGALLEHYQTGDTVPFAQRPYIDRQFVFPLTLENERNYDLYLRIRSEGSMTVPLFVWKRASFIHASRESYMAIMLYFGVLLTLVIYNTLLYISLRDRIYLYYLGFVVSIGLAMGAWNGLFFEYLWPDSPRWANLAAVIGFSLTGMFGAIFSRNFLVSGRYSPTLDRLLFYCVVAFALLMMAAPFIHYRYIAMSLSGVGIIFSLIAVASGVHCLQRGQHSARYFLLAWSMLLLGTALLGARNFGLLPTDLLTRYTMQFGSAIEVLLFSFALADRISELSRSKVRAEEEAVAANKTMVETLQRTELELEQRVSEQTRELMTINHQLREQESRLMGLALYDSLTGLANRVLLEERIAEALASANERQQIVALLLIDLDEFKPINDTYGHEVGDEVLRVVAARLQEGVRGSDTVARLGGDEFVIVLPALSDQLAALEIAQSLLQALSNSIKFGDLKLNIGASIGIAYYPDDGMDSAALMHQADMAMYETKRNRRGEDGDIVFA